MAAKQMNGLTDNSSKTTTGGTDRRNRSENRSPVFDWRSSLPSVLGHPTRKNRATRAAGSRRNF
ncbi:hypothetical protein I656_03558 [Geobacillus sp. WSUCF1]|nr:hypothetical protein I656_03558 [Geobacillus sp. WSUCF1]